MQGVDLFITITDRSRAEQFAAWFRTLNQIAAYIAEHRQQPGGTSSGRDGGGAGHAQEISRV